MFNLGFENFLRIVMIAICIAIIVYIRCHTNWTISSAESKNYVSQLTGFKPTGVPIIVFASNECAASNNLEAQLKKDRLPYIRADVDHNEIAVQLQNKVGMSTPTTVVGTKVIVGGEAKDILKELSTERLNKDFY